MQKQYTVTAAKSIGCDLKDTPYDILTAIGFQDVGHGNLIGTIEHGDIAICGNCHDGFISIENYKTNELSLKQLNQIKKDLASMNFETFKSYMEDEVDHYYVDSLKDFEELITFIII